MLLNSRAYIARNKGFRFDLFRGLAGHSKWANIRHRKEKNDLQKAATNTRMSRAIVAAIKASPDNDADPASNFHLDAAIRRAHKSGVPNSVIEKAIASATGHGSHGELHHVTYEGSGPSGVLFIVEALTDNKNRTAPAVRHIFRAHGGHMESKVADFAFERRGYMEVDVTPEAVDELLDFATEKGAMDFLLPEATDVQEVEPNEEEKREHVTVKLYSDPKDMMPLSRFLKDKGYQVAHERMIRFPTQVVHVEDDDTAETLHKLMDALEENEDVSEVFHNIG